MRSLAVLVLALITATASAAPEPISVLMTGRTGDAFDLFWLGDPGADGFRVYRYSELDCSQGELVYEGWAAGYSDPEAFADDSLRIYRIAAYDATGEGPLSGPVYKYTVDLSAPSAVSFPYWRGFLFPEFSDELCLEHSLNGTPLESVASIDPATGDTTTYVCDGAMEPFQLNPGAAYLVSPRQTPTSIQMWGHGHGDPPHGGWLLDFVQTGDASEPFGGPGSYVVSLPYDHAYTDLTQIADEIPSAISIGVLDHQSGEFTGLTRTSSLDSWSGSSPSLADRRGEALYVKVDLPAAWEPSRLCAAECPVPLAPVQRLELAKSQADPADLTLSWLHEWRADGGYAVFVEVDKTQIQSTSLRPEHLQVEEPRPAFPILDAGAVPETPGIRFYQVVGRCADGSLGRL